MAEVGSKGLLAWRRAGTGRGLCAVAEAARPRSSRMLAKDAVVGLHIVDVVGVEPARPRSRLVRRAFRSANKWDSISARTADAPAAVPTRLAAITAHPPT
ncbi:hypothetical protein GCM10022273_32080 [Cellulomonas soli]